MVFTIYEAPGFWGTGEQGHLIQGNRGTKANFSGEQRNKDNLFQGEKGTGALPGIGRVSHMGVAAILVM